jgi:p24 family protein delta-1
MEYLRGREQKLRDTNESTNERVKWFAFGTMGMLVGLGAWQIVYLRAYFRWVVEASEGGAFYCFACVCLGAFC